MGCNLDKFTTYKVKDVVRAGERNVVHFAEPIASCPDGTLNNSKTQVKQVDREGGLLMTLTWSERLGRPVVIVPANYEVKEVVDPEAEPAVAVAPAPPEATRHYGLGVAAVGAVGFLALLIAVIWKVNKWRPTATAATMRSWEHPSNQPPPLPASPPPSRAMSAATHVAAGVAGAAAGYAVASASRAKKKSEEEQSSSTAYVPSASTYDSGSSYSDSSSSSSYSSDSGSSYGSDSGSSSFGSD